MNTASINHMLNENQDALLEFYKAQNQGFVNSGPEGKWSAGQHLVHLVQSTEPLVKALRFPNFFLRWKFGKPNREARNYDEVVAKYHQKLSDGERLKMNVVSPYSKTMPDIDDQNITQWKERFIKVNQKLAKLSTKYSQSDLNSILLPHPLMGKMMLGEMLMWNAYHTKHHHNILIEKYS
jgi:hypothetical protein